MDFDLNFEKSLVVNKRHMKKSEGDKLDENGNFGFEVEKYRYGYRIRTIDINMDNIRSNWSQGFYSMCALAKDNDCTWVHFDCDGQVVGGFPSYIGDRIRKVTND